MKRLLLFLCLAATAYGYDTVIVRISTDTSPWTIPGDFNNADNQIVCIGRGGTGSTRVSTSQGGNGGGGGAYAVKTNVNLGSGTAAFQIGSSGSAVVTWIKDSGGTIQVQAAIGTNATAANGGHGVGGVAASCTPSAGAQSGGNGGDSVVADAGAGGGGSGGPSGAGGAGAVGATINGGTADGGVVAQQTTQGATGNSGTEFDSTHGCGGGGAGGVGGGSRAGGAGGVYGGGGGGADSGTAAAGGGTSGLIVISYNKLNLNTNFLQMFSRKENQWHKSLSILQPNRTLAFLPLSDQFLVLGATRLLTKLKAR